MCATGSGQLWDAVAPFDRRFTALGCKLLFLEAAPHTIWQPGIQPRTTEQFILEYSRKFGRTDEEIHGYFVEEQKSLQELFCRSAMPKLQLDLDCPSADKVEPVYQFWVAPLQQTLAISR